MLSSVGSAIGLSVGGCVSGSPRSGGGSNTIPRTGLLFYAKAPGMADSIGLLITPDQVPAEYRSVFFNGETLRSPAEILALALASPYLNMGYMIGSAEFGIVLYAIGTPQSTLVKALKVARQYSVVWPTSWLPRVKFSVSGSVAETSNQIIKIRVHHGSHDGDYTNQDIFCDGLCKTDFSDVRFAMADGTLLPQWRASYGNWEFIQDDTRLPTEVVVDSSGNLWAIAPLGAAGLYKSTENGTTWVQKNATSTSIVFVDSRGYVYTQGTGGDTNVYRSTDDGVTPTAVFTRSSADAAILPRAAVEDASGHLYFGQYQDADNVMIYRSTDGGANWTVVLHIPAAASSDPVIGTTSPKGSAQHVHAMAVDPYTGSIYAGMDANGGAPDPGIALYRSIDGGDTWAAVWDSLSADCMGFVFYNDHRLFGGESGDDEAIVLTEDDETYTTVVPRWIYGQLAKDGDTVIGGGGTAGEGMRYPQLVRSTDQGYRFETILMEEFNDEVGFSLGHEYGGSRNQFYTPAGATERQFIMGSDGSKVKPGRFYNNLTGRHEAEFYVKIPTLPAAGTDIYCYFGNGGAENVSNPTSLYTQEVVLDGLVARYKLTEGSGTTAADSAGNHDGVITGGSWHGEQVAEFGTGRIPYQKLPGCSLVFDGTTSVTIPGSDSHADFNFTKNFSIVGWIDMSEVGDFAIIAKGDCTANNGWAIVARNGGANPTLEFGYSNGSANTRKNATTAPRLGQSIMYGIVVDNASPPNISFITNGDLLAPIALSYEPITGTGPVVIGALSNLTKKLAGAKQGDIRIYKGKALTQQEVRSIYEHRVIPATNEPAINYIGLVEDGPTYTFSRIDYTKITGTIRYVGAYPLNGDGSHPGPALTAGGRGAFNNFTAAINACAASGDGIIIMPGTYAGSTQALTLGTKQIYIASAYGMDTVTIDGQDARRTASVLSGQTSATVIDGIHLTRGYSAGGAGGGINVSTASPTLKNIKISLSGTTTANTKGGGMAFSNSTSILENIVLDRNFVSATGGRGGNIHVASSSALTINNLSSSGGAGQYGAGINDESAATTYKNVIDSGNATLARLTTVPSGSRVTYSNIRKDAAAYTGTGNINADPLFVSATDLRLQAGSPCRNTGAAITGRTTDILGNAVDETPDMGAYEND